MNFLSTNRVAVFVLSFFITLAMKNAAAADITPYTTLLKDGDVEIRQYPEMIWVTAPINEGKRNSAFRSLFSYIRGKNQIEQKIPMTAPVFMSEGLAASEAKPMPSMAFVMPEGMSLEDTPKPSSTMLEVSQQPPTTFASIRFKGRLTEKNINKHKKELENWLKDKELTVLGEPLSAGYNSPFTPPFMRRNEILIAVAYAP